MIKAICILIAGTCLSLSLSAQDPKPVTQKKVVQTQKTVKKKTYYHSTKTSTKPAARKVVHRDTVIVK